MDRQKKKKMLPNFEYYDENHNLRDLKLKVGQDFTNSKVFKNVGKEYAIRSGRTVYFPCNEKKKRVQGMCKGKTTKCPW